MNYGQPSLSSFRRFGVSADTIRNALPDSVVSASSVDSVQLKAFLLRQSFCRQHFGGTCSSVYEWMNEEFISGIESHIKQQKKDVDTQRKQNKSAE